MQFAMRRRFAAATVLAVACLAIQAPQVALGFPAPPDKPALPHIEGDASPVVNGTPKAWGLAADAVLTEENGGSHRLLGCAHRDADGQAKAIDVLSKWWDIDNRAELLEKLQWLDQTGNRQNFEQVGKFVDSLNDTFYWVVLHLSGTDTQRGYQLDVAHHNHAALGTKSLLGWDMTRYVDVARRGYEAGYLTEDEAWARIMQASVRLQSTFSSWQELSDNYMLGRQFWSRDQYQRRLGATSADIQRLLHDPRSPWLLNPWNLDLAHDPTVQAAIPGSSNSPGTGDAKK